MRAIIDVIYVLLNLATFVVFVYIIMSWLLSARKIDLRNPTIANIWTTLGSIIEPILRPIRNLLPRTGMLDLAPLVLVIGIFFLQRVLIHYVYPNVI